MRINTEQKSMDMEARDINYILPAYVRSYLFYSKNEMPEKIIFPMFASVKVGDKEIPIEYVPALDAVAVEIAKDGDNIAEVTPEQEAVLDEKDEEIIRLKKELADAIQTGRGGEEVGGAETEETTSEQLKDEASDLELEEDTGESTTGLTEEEQTYEAAKADQPESPAKAAFAESEEPKGTPIEIAENHPARFKVDPDPTHQPPPDRQPGQPPGGDIGPGLGLSDMHSRDRGDQVRTARDLTEEPNIDESEEKEFDKEVSRDEQGRPVVEDKPDAPSG